jgi:formiminotetrahydrofolate cyclodeaminase
MPDLSYGDQKLLDFLERLASSKPTPGGGAALSLVSSLVSALGAMVASLSQGKKFAEIEKEMKEIEGWLKSKSLDFLSLAQKDEQVFREFLQAFRANKENQVPSHLIPVKAKEAISIPLKLIEELALMFPAFKLLLEKGNPNLISDIGIACFLAAAAIRASTLNVLINLPWVKEETFQKETLTRVQQASQAASDFDNMAQAVRKLLEGGE